MRKLTSGAAAAWRAAVVFVLAAAPGMGAEPTGGASGPAGTEAVQKEALRKEKASSWFDDVKIKGDLRYRYEGVFRQGAPDQNRNRIRARIAIEAKASDWLDAVFQLATGSNDPVSNNQTIGDGFTGKGIWIYQAALDAHPVDGLHVLAGKIRNPFCGPQGTELIWDGDLCPEGAAATVALKAGKGIELSAALGGFFVQEHSADPDTSLIGLQAGLKANLLDGTLNFRLSGGFFHYENLKGRTPLYTATNSMGNSTISYLNSAGTRLYFYSNHFELLELQAETGIKIGSVALSAFVDFVSNRKVDDDGNGWLAGARAKLPQGIDARVNYRELQKDAVVGAFTDSDFIGGGTNGRGWEVGADWDATKNLKVGFSWFLDWAPHRDWKLYRRLQMDVEVKF